MRRPPRSTLFPYPTLFRSMAGMAIAVVTTLAAHPPADGIGWVLVILGVGIGGSIGVGILRRVPMTSMPELVADAPPAWADRKGTRLNSSHATISDADLGFK